MSLDYGTDSAFPIQGSEDTCREYGFSKYEYLVAKFMAAYIVHHEDSNIEDSLASAIAAADEFEGEMLIRSRERYDRLMEELNKK